MAALISAKNAEIKTNRTLRCSIGWSQARGQHPPGEEINFVRISNLLNYEIDLYRKNVELRYKGEKKWLKKKFMM